MEKEMEKMIKEREPFWYQQDGIEPPSSTSAAYEYDKGLSRESPDETTLKEKVGLDDDRNYIPGKSSNYVASQHTQPA